MTSADQVVRRLLDSIEQRIDLDHVEKVRSRHRTALSYQLQDVPPLVCYIPYEGTEFTPYPYPEAFADPAKLMVNELLIGFTSIYHAVDLPSDNPYCLRANLGAVIIASMFGSGVRLVENNMPWAAPLGSLDKLRAVAEAPLPDVRSGLGQRVLDQFAYYHDVLRDYPKCRASFELTFPDLQGPFDIAEMLWGSNIFGDLFEEGELLQKLLGKITSQMLAFYRLCEPHVSESLAPEFHMQHGCSFRGKLLLRCDTCLLLSPKMYREMVMPHDARLSAELGGVAIHFCGDGSHQVDNMLSIPGMQGFDLGQPHFMDMDAFYAKVAPRKVILTHMNFLDRELTARQVRERYPSGVIMTYQAESVADAQRAWTRYIA